MLKLGPSSVVLVAISLLCSVAQAFEPSKRILVTDIDDTIKLTHVLNKPDAFFRALFSKRAFPGMSTLYREMKAPYWSNENDEPMTYYVSGSPSILGSILDAFLNRNDFPRPADVRLRGSLGTSTYDFKVKEISEILNSEREASAIFIGDDGEKDPDAYRDVSKSFPGRVDAIYIHRIRNRELPPEQLGYDTAMDIALNEVAAGRLSAHSALAVAESIFAASEKNLILPDSYCPEESAPRESARLWSVIGFPRVLKRARQIEDLIRRKCRELAEEAEYRRSIDFPLNSRSGG